MNLHRKFARVPIRFAFSRMQASIERCSIESNYEGITRRKRKEKEKKMLERVFFFPSRFDTLPLYTRQARGQVESEQFILIARPWIQKVHKSWSIDTNSEIGMMERLMIENLTSGSK